MSFYVKPEQMFDPEALSAFELFERNTFQIPVYQRPYSWTKEEATEFFEDVKESFLTQLQLFVGTIYIKESNLNRGMYATDYEVIDGQQRFTTLALIFLNLYTILSRIDKNKELSVEIGDLKNILWKKSNPNVPLLVSSSIENKVLKKLFDTAFQNSANYQKQLVTLLVDSELNVIEKNLVEVATYLYNQFELFINENVNKAKNICQFILYKISVISIIVKESNQRVFSIFESINSKGKQLDEIDLIKTYIFSQIPMENNESQIYLERWGELTIKTKNKLENYLWIFIKGFVKYYKGNVTLKIFKTLIKNEELNAYYHIPKGAPNHQVFEALIDDLIDKLDCYAALTDVEFFKRNITGDKDVLLQFQIFTILKYKHPQPLFLRAIYEFKNSVQDAKDKEKLSEIFKYANSFMVESQSLVGKDSKDSIPVFNNIMNFSYKRSKLDFNYIKTTFRKELLVQNIDQEEISKRLFNLNTYKEEIGKIMLVIAESYHDENFFSADKANQLLNHEKLSIDHLLPQNPDESGDFIYGRVKVDNDEKNDVLVLKHGADFPSNIYDRMLYSEFENLVLNKLGNLHLLERDSNSHKSNDSIPDMKFYRDIRERQDDFTNKIINAGVFYIPQDSEFTQVMQDLSPKLLDLTKPNTAINRKFRLVNFFDKEILVNSAKEALQRIFSELYRYDPQEFVKLKDLGTDIRPFISQYQGDLTSASKIENSSWFIETNNNNPYNVRRIIKALEIYNINPDKLKIFYE